MCTYLVVRLGVGNDVFLYYNIIAYKDMSAQKYNANILRYNAVPKCASYTFGKMSHIHALAYRQFSKMTILLLPPEKLCYVMPN